MIFLRKLRKKEPGLSHIDLFRIIPDNIVFIGIVMTWVGYEFNRAGAHKLDACHSVKITT